MLTKSQFKKSVSNGFCVSFTNTSNRKYFVNYYFSATYLLTEYFDKLTLEFAKSSILDFSSVSDSFNVYRSCAL